MDLHAWITQQVDAVESTARLIAPGGYAPDEWRIEPSRSGRWTHLVAYSRLNNEAPEAAVREGDRPVALVQAERNEDQFIAMHDPAAILRRCEADRRILARHAPQPNGTGFDDGWQCQTCSVDGGDGYQYLVPYPCPTVEDLAHAHGVTPDVLAGLDHPRPPGLPADAAYELRITSYPTPPITTSDVPDALRGPRWKP